MKHLIIRRTIALFILGCLLPPSPSWAADDARTQFQAQFGAALKQVRPTSDKADDIELAKKMIEAAKAGEAEATYVALLCDQAFVRRAVGALYHSGPRPDTGHATNHPCRTMHA